MSRYSDRRPYADERAEAARTIIARGLAQRWTADAILGRLKEDGFVDLDLALDFGRKDDMTQTYAPAGPAELGPVPTTLDEAVESIYRLVRGGYDWHLDDSPDDIVVWKFVDGARVEQGPLFTPEGLDRAKELQAAYWDLLDDPHDPMLYFSRHEDTGVAEYRASSTTWLEDEEA